MRKILLISASVFALGAGNVLADQSTTIDDSSEGSVNEINQTAPGTESTILVTQIGEGADAPGTGTASAGTNVLINQVSDDDSLIDVSQEGLGDGNSTYVNQEALGGVSLVMVTQTGEANQADIMQIAADSDVTLMQSGEGNMATVSQMADENTATVGQWGEGNEAFVDQMANENIASVDQWGEMNIATVVQDGMTNNADVDQGADGTMVEMNTAMVTQSGTESFVVVSQLGSENFASAMQNAGVSDGATITINQTGTGGSSTVIQN